MTPANGLWKWPCGGWGSRRAHTIAFSLKVARTIADLGRTESVGAKHLAEAIQYCSWIETTGTDRDLLLRLVLPALGIFWRHIIFVAPMNSHCAGVRQKE